MSLIDSRGATDTVTVIVRAMGKDSRNARVPVEVGRVLCRGRLQPATQADVERLQGSGTSVLELWRFSCAQFPGDDISQVEADGRLFDVVATPARHRSSRNTRRDVVLLSAANQQRRLPNGTGV